MTRRAQAPPSILAGVFSRWLSSPRNDRRWRVAVAAHAAAVIFLVGMIWTVHLIHYPLFAEVGPAEYVSFQAEHVRRIGALLLAPWVAEGVTTAALLLLARSRRECVIVLAISATAAGVLLISGLASAPAHADLADGFDPDVHGRLMDWNLLRALLWTANGVLSAALVWGLVAHGSRPPMSGVAPLTQPDSI